MTIKNTSQPTPYLDINALLSEWTEGVRHMLGDNVVGLYLSGSLSYGGFVRERSDIDLQAVVRQQLTEIELRLVERLHTDLDQRHPAWKGRLECSYVPLALLREIDPPATPRPWWGFDRLYAAAPAGNEWLINHYFLYRYGITLIGPAFNTLIPPPDIREVRKASARDLFKEWAPKINDPDWLSNSHYQSYLVLHLCRILHTTVGHEPSSKRVAAHWAKARYPQWQPLIVEAEQWAFGMEMKRSAEVIAFLQFSIGQVKKAGLDPAFFQ